MECGSKLVCPPRDKWRREKNWFHMGGVPPYAFALDSPMNLPHGASSCTIATHLDWSRSYHLGLRPQETVPLIVPTNIKRDYTPQSIKSFQLVLLVYSLFLLLRNSWFCNWLYFFHLLPCILSSLHWIFLTLSLVLNHPSQMKSIANWAEEAPTHE